MSNMYVLDENNNPVPAEDSIAFKARRNNSNRIIGRTNIGDVLISTVFLTIDHNFSGIGDPILFETMIFGGKNYGYQERYSTYKEAIAGHEKAVRAIINGESLE